MERCSTGVTLPEEGVFEKEISEIGVLRIEALVEDLSGTYLIRSLLQNYFKEREGKKIPYEVYLRPHRGIGTLPTDLSYRPNRHHYGLLNLLPAKLRAYEHSLDKEHSLLLIVLDADKKDPAELQSRINRLVEKQAPSLDHVVAVAVEELEAWLLGDFTAIKKAYPQADEKIYKRYRQDSISGTWEQLAEIILGKASRSLIRAGYPAVGTYKCDWAEKISPNLQVGRNRSPSLRRFLTELDQVLASREL